MICLSSGSLNTGGLEFALNCENYESIEKLLNCE